MSAAFPLAFFNSPWGWIAVLFIALLLFGARLPKMARNMGKGINEFKKGLNEGLSDDERAAPNDQGTAAGPSKKKTDIEETSV